MDTDETRIRKNQSQGFIRVHPWLMVFQPAGPLAYTKICQSENLSATAMPASI
jgi:hypothetical protein